MARIADSLRAEIQKAVLDFVTQARGPAAPGSTFLTGDARIDSMVRRLTRDGQRTQGRGNPALDQGMFRAPPAPRPNALSREAFAERAANLGSPRRVFVSFPTLSSRWQVVAPQVDSLVDSIRTTLARDGRYLVIPADSVRAALAQTRTISALANALDVELFVSINASVLPDTSVVFQITTRDLTAHSSYASRAVANHAQRPNLLTGADSLVTQAKRFLREQDYAPRRAAPRDQER
jgi:hypothetical protein